MHHPLHGHSKTNLEVFVARLLTVKDGSALEERSPTRLHRENNVVGANDVEKGALLPREARFRQVLRRRGTSYRHRAFTQLFVGLANLGGDVGRHRRIDYPLPDARGAKV